jgi:hypothetical protein
MSTRVLLGDGGLTLTEFVKREPLLLSTIQDAVFDFLENRDDAVVYGAQAVNAYVRERRATEDVDLASTRGEALADELRAYLSDRFRIAVRVREVRGGIGYRLYQVRKEGNRHLVDVRPVPVLPPSRRIEKVQVVEPVELVAGKTLAYTGRQGKPKAFTDRRDLAVLLLRFPELQSAHGPVRDRLLAMGADAAVLEAWEELVAQQIVPEDEDGEFSS